MSHLLSGGKIWSTNAGDPAGQLTHLARTQLLAAQARFGAGLGEQQGVVLRLADLLMLAYAALSAQARTAKLGHPALAQALTELYAFGAGERAARLTRELSDVLGTDWRALVAPPQAAPPDTFALREQIAAAVLDAGGYTVCG